MKLNLKNYLIAVSLFLISLSGCSYTPDALPLNKEQALKTATFSFDQETYPGPDNLFPIYLIKPGDTLDILFQIKSIQTTDDFKLRVGHEIAVKFYNTPEFNETQRVMPDGTIVLPFVGQLYVADKSLKAFTDELKKIYARILRDPELSVRVLNVDEAIKELKTDLHTAPRGLSRLVTVRPDGFATFPMLGDVHVAGKKIPDVNRELDSLYAKVVPGLHVDLFLEKTQGAVVFVMGEVFKAGAFEIAKPISIFEAIALAGGHRDDARLDNIIVFRRKEREIFARRVDLMGFLSAKEDREYFYVKPDDIIYVPSTKVASAGNVMKHVADILFFRGWAINVDLFENGLIKNHNNF